MLSRVVVSQVKHNSYFLAGLAFGLFVALVGVPFEDTVECPGPVGPATVPQLDEFAAERAERPAGAATGGQSRSLQRPRYYTTELGMRAPLLAAVLSSEDQLGPGGRAHALNATLSALGSARRVFVAATGSSAGNRPPASNVVAFTDTREMLKPFHALKYLADNHLDEYDFFYIVSDESYVNARGLLRLARGLSVSQDVYMGSVAADDSHYCTLEGGILLSNSVLRLVHGELDWCVRNSYSAHHHENIGRCVLHAAHIRCTAELQRKIYSVLSDSESVTPLALSNAIAVHPVRVGQRMFELHAAAARGRLQYTSLTRRARALTLRRALRLAPAGFRNASWPRGLRDDPGLAPQTPESRWDYIRWTSFNATHAFLLDDHHACVKIEGAHASALALVSKAAIAFALRTWSASDASIMEGAWSWQPPRALQYRLVLRVKQPDGREILKQVEVSRPLGAARLVPVPYVTESARVWIILPTKSDLLAALAFLRRYETACLQRRANTALVVVVEDNSVADDVRDAVKGILARHSSAVIYVTDSLDKGDVAILDAALKHTPRDALLLLATSYMDFNEDFLNRVRMNCISGSQWFLPVAFARFSVYTHPRLVRDGARPNTGTGRFNVLHTDVLAVHRPDYEKARSRTNIPISELKVANMLQESGLRVIRAPEPGLVITRPRPCVDKDYECLQLLRNQGLEKLDLGARHTLAKLLLEVEAESD